MYCKYCRKDFSVLESNGHIDAELIVDYEGLVVMVDLPEERVEIHFDANYCPMCGSELEG